MAARPLLGFVSLVLLAGGCLLLFFIVLSGDGLGLPENKVYFLRADTSQIPAAHHAVSAWTFLSICGYSDGKLVNCGSKHPALPFDPPGNFGTQKGVPETFIGTHYYYYMSRFSWAFFLIALFFGVSALFTGVLALCTRIGAYLSSFLCSVAAFFQLIAAALMTTWAVKGRNVFQGAGRSANLGEYAFAFAWSSAACFMLAMILFCVSGSSSKGSSVAKRSRFGTFGRKRSTRSRGSFRDTTTEDGGIKDDYS